MDFVNGGELFSHLNTFKKFSEPRSRQYAAELVEFFSYMHANGVIYRDLKPENVLIAADGHLKIIDFGLAKTGMVEGQLSNSFCGTIEYMAPEIAAGEGHTFSADWFSLGALLYEMLCGLAPHYSENQRQMLENRIKGQIKMLKIFSANA